MWIACKTQKESALDRFLGLSPEVYLGPENFALIDLGGVGTYWKLHRLAADFASENWAHPLLLKLSEFNKKEGLSFVLAPTATWAFFVGKNFFTSPIDFWTQTRFEKQLQNSSLNLAGDFIPDLLSQSHENLKALEDFRVHMDELGFSNLGQLLNFTQEHTLGMRFGRPLQKLMQRLRGKSELEFLQYEAPPVLQETFYPLMEHEMDSENQRPLLLRFEELLTDWEERLRCRQSLLCGLHVEILSYRQHKKHMATFKLPRPSRDPQLLLKILQEKVPFGDFEIEKVQMRSLGLQNERDRQMSLFDPKREEILEDWSLLFAKLQTRGGSRLGTYQAFPSYFPERAVEWVDWEENFQSESIQEHPPRPEIILREPKLLRSLTHEQEFYSFLEKFSATPTLERIRDSLSLQERSYARVGNEWVFWDADQKKLFLHGYFESTA